VVASVAKQLGVSKSEVLDRNADSMAVQLALGETQVIAQTKKDLEVRLSTLFVVVFVFKSTRFTVLVYSNA